MTIATPSPQALMVVGIGLLFHFAMLVVKTNEGDQADLFIYRAGSDLALHGQSPYNLTNIQGVVAERFPPKMKTDLAYNCGFFLPPQAIPIFTPYTLVPWKAAEILWGTLLGIMALLTASLAWTFGRSPERQGRGWEWVVATVLVNPLTRLTMLVGQTGLLFVGCVALGQWLHERGRPRLAALLWAVPFVKPHLALFLLGVAFALDGWRRVLAIVIAIAGLNLLGILLSGPDWRMPWDYLELLRYGHKAVLYNQVAESRQITSWNRLLFVLNGPAIDLGFGGTLIGYAIWSLAVWLRVRLSGLSASPAYVLAMGAVGGVLVCQVLGYELLVLCLLASLLLQWLDSGKRGFRGGSRVAPFPDDSR